MDRKNRVIAVCNDPAVPAIRYALQCSYSHLPRKPGDGPRMSRSDNKRHFYQEALVRRDPLAAAAKAAVTFGSISLVPPSPK